jgi:5-methyltetrahydropteroyltriglutamate--homocysteine methyltransferase
MAWSSGVVADGIPEEVRIGLHVCYGDYSRIYPELNEFPVDEVDLELCNGDYEQIEVFADEGATGDGEPGADGEFAPDLALGVVDAHTASVEPVEEIEANIKQGLKVVPPEKLTISPDCGLKLLPREVAYGKMENLVQAARRVEEELDAGRIDVPARDVAPADD